MDKLGDVVEAEDELGDVVEAKDELEDIVEDVDKLEDVVEAELTVAAAGMTADMLSFSLSKKHSVPSFWLTPFSIGRHSAGGPWESEVMGRVRYSSSAFSAKSSTSVVPCGVSLS